ncbi:hypothetical protein TDB9533_02252 [Thalassocella blandensis]|nr:hypothetical protein TDB9533_02252 [Thalassocella blandensis]
MEEKILSSFNAQNIMDQSNWNFRRTWKGSVDVSVWLKAKMQKNARIYLVLQYKDKETKRAIPIDRCLGGATESVLLNGRVNIAGNGLLEQFVLKVKYEGCIGSVAVEELTVTFPNTNNAIRTMKLAV